MERMGDPNLAPEERFTYRHYRTWPDSERWELIHGHAWAMSPAPRTRHQDLAADLITQLRVFLRGKPCKAFAAPFDVLLPAGGEADDEVDTVVQPDVVVFCDRSKITEAGARGAPDLAIEILSPSTSKKDMNDKFQLYESRGVREYWVVDPGNRSILVFRLGPDGRYDEGELRERGREYGPIGSAVLPGFSVDPESLFAEMD
ncbi:MAG: Uma2 family endonuclease [Spirochaetaceae bacterium]|nr:Uma2 family endonuclease [Spirochaetaceae bacterium]